MTKRYLDVRIEMVEHEDNGYHYHEVIGVHRSGTDLNDHQITALSDFLEASEFGGKELPEGLLNAVSQGHHSF